MKAANLHRTKNIYRHLFAIAAILLLLLSSCPIKFNIKSLSATPVETELSSGKKVNLYSTPNQPASIQCAAIETTVTGFSNTLVSDSLFALIFTTIIPFLFPFQGDKKILSLFFRGSNSGEAVPIYLQHRTLII